MAWARPSSIPKSMSWTDTLAVLLRACMLFSTDRLFPCGLIIFSVILESATGHTAHRSPHRSPHTGRQSTPPRRVCRVIPYVCRLLCARECQCASSTPRGSAARARPAPLPLSELRLRFPGQRSRRGRRPSRGRTLSSLGPSLGVGLIRGGRF